MKKALGILLATLLVAGLFTIVLADARTNLRIKTEVDEERYKIYKLVNLSDRTIHAKVALEKRCSGVSNGKKKPIVTEHWVSANSEIELGRAWPQSTCRRTYRVVEAQY
jgi:hypothetical protein